MALATSDTAHFEAAAADIRRHAAGSWAQALRDRGLERFLAAGFPTTRLEDWKSTNVGPFVKIPFHAAPEGSSASASTAEEWLPRDGEGPRIVLVNGRCVPELSRGTVRRDGVVVRSLRVALAEHRELIEPVLDSLAASSDSAFTALNAALFEDGAFAWIPPGVTVEEPIHVVHVTSSRGETVATHARVVVVAGEGARVCVIETHGGHEGETLSNPVTEIHVRAGASVEHVRVQRQAQSAFQIASTFARLERGASLASASFALGGRLSRHETSVELAGPESSARLDGLALLAGSQHGDHHVFVDHVAPHARSEQLFKYACAGRSRGVFRGRVRVGKDAQDTNAQQQNRNLILSDDALVDTKPQLEILADDVRCTHGATIGQLEPDQLFYLRARGLDEAAARHVLVEAFAGEMLDRLGSAAVRDDLRAVVTERLGALEAAS